MIRILLLALTALVQLGSVGWMIVGREITIAEGTEVKFVVVPADPYDPFSGRYVRLRFEANTFMGSPDLEDANVQGEMRYAILSVDAQGYATVRTLSKTLPQPGEPYLKVVLRYSHKVPERDGKPAHTLVHLSIPFDRYYMNEAAAPEAEKLYSEVNRANWEARRAAIRQTGEEEPMSRENYLLVRIRNGTGVPVELYLNGQTVESQLSGGK